MGGASPMSPRLGPPARGSMWERWWDFFGTSAAFEGGLVRWGGTACPPRAPAGGASGPFADGAAGTCGGGGGGGGASWDAIAAIRVAVSLAS